MSLAEYGMYKHASCQLRFYSRQLREYESMYGKIQKSLQQAKKNQQQALSMKKQSLYSVYLAGRQAMIDNVNSQPGAQSDPTIQANLNNQLMQKQLEYQNQLQALENMDSQKNEADIYILEDKEAYLGAQKEDAKSNVDFWKGMKDQYKDWYKDENNK